MKKWEYLTYGVNSESTENEDTILKQKGEQGWELVAVIFSGGFSGTYTNLYFKRELQ